MSVQGMSSSLFCGRNALWVTHLRFFCVAALLSLLFSLCCYMKDLPVLPQGPSFAMAEVTRSIVHSGSLTPPYFHSVHRDASALSEATASEVWQDVFAWGKDGRLLPKHSMLSAIIATPFYAVFGDTGFWILQQLLFLCLVFVTYLLVAAITGVPLPWTTIVSVFVLTPSLFYSYGFGYELHSCVLIMGGLYLMRWLPALGAGLMVLSILVRPSEILIALPLAMVSGGLMGKRQGRAAALGIGVVMVGWCALNTYLWGGPFLTAYSRLPGFRNGNMFVSACPIGFDVNELFSGWAGKIFSEQGLLPYTPAVLALPFIVVSYRRRRDTFMRACLLISIAYGLYIFSYPMWSVTNHGNRFLFSATYLYLLCFIPFAGRIELRYLPRPRGGSGDAAS